MITLPTPPSRVQVVGIFAGLIAFLGAFPVLFFNEQRIDPLVLTALSSQASIIAALHTEYLVVTWVLRGFGLLLAWIGVLLLWIPLARMLRVSPYLAQAKTAAVTVMTLPFALALTTIAVLLSSVLESAVVLTIIAVTLPTVLIGVLRANRPNPAAALPEAE